MQDRVGGRSIKDFGAWRETDQGSQPTWEARAQVISHFIRPTDSVLDLGAGDQKLRKYLPGSCQYIPVDCIDVQPDTFAVHFNREFRLPECDFNVIVAADFLEYIANLPEFMGRLAAACTGRFFLFTYHYTPRDPAKQGHAFRKMNTLSDAQECSSFFSKYVDDLHEVLSFKDQGLFAGILSPDAKRRPHSVPTINAALERRKPWPRWWPRVVDRLRLTTASHGLAAAVRNERLTYYSLDKLKRLEGTLADVLNRGAPGDIVEFGVALGGSAIVLAAQARHHGRAFHGFDVFGMIPAPASDKDDARSKHRYEVIASGQSNGIGGDTYYGYRQNLFEEVRASFARHGLPVDGTTVTLHKGLFQEAWPSYNGEAIAFAHIDCDWYDPVKFCLERVADRLSPGGAIVLDDYHNYGGCRTAAAEFLSARADFMLDDGAITILRRPL